MSTMFKSSFIRTQAENEANSFTQKNPVWLRVQVQSSQLFYLTFLFFDWMYWPMYWKHCTKASQLGEGRKLSFTRRNIHRKTSLCMQFTRNKRRNCISKVITHQSLFLFTRKNMFAQLSLELHTVSYHTNNEAHSAFIMQLALNLRGSILYFHNVHKEKENWDW